MITDVVIQDGVTAQLEIFGKDQPKILDRVLRNTAYSFRQFVKKNYMSGQMLHRVTGETWNWMRHAKTRGLRHDFVIWQKGGLANIYEHQGGADIVPKHAKMLRWVEPDGTVVFAKRVHLDRRPYMSSALAAYPWETEPVAIAEKVYEREIKNRGLDPR